MDKAKHHRRQPWDGVILVCDTEIPTHVLVGDEV